TRALQRLEDARVPVDHPEQRVALDVLRRAHEQETVGLERIVKRGADLRLQVAVEIDEQVAAGDQVDVRERGVLQQAMLGENDEVAHLAPDPVVVAVAGEEAPQALLRYVCLDRQWIAAVPAGRERTCIDIRREKLDLRPLVATRAFLEEKDGYG